MSRLEELSRRAKLLSMCSSPSRCLASAYLVLSCRRRRCQGKVPSRTIPSRSKAYFCSQATDPGVRGPQHATDRVCGLLHAKLAHRKALERCRPGRGRNDRVSHLEIVPVMLAQDRTSTTGNEQRVLLISSQRDAVVKEKLVVILSRSIKTSVPWPYARSKIASRSVSSSVCPTLF